MSRTAWLQACTLARRRGSIPTTLPMLVAAYRIAHDRTDWRAFADPGFCS